MRGGAHVARRAACRPPPACGTPRCRTRGGSAGRSWRRCIACPAADRESRNPRPARGARAREAKRWTSQTVSDHRRGDEQEHQQPVVGAAAGGDRHDRTATRSASCAGMRAPVSAWVDRRQARRSPRPAGCRRAGRARRSRPSRSSDQRSTSRASAAASRARAAEEADAERSHEAGGGQRGGQRQQRAVDRDHQLQAPLRQVADAAGSPGRSATRRRSRSAAAGRRSPCSRPGTRTRSSACGGSARPGAPCRARRCACQHRAGAEEQQALEQRSG